MAYDLRRAALLSLCALAVVVAASLFPATGFGSYPAGVGGGGDDPATGPDAGATNATTETTPSESDGTDGSVATTTAPSDGDETDESESAGDDGGTDGTTTTTETATPTSTETAAPSNANETVGGGLLLFLFAALAAFGVLFVGVVGGRQRGVGSDVDADVPLPQLRAALQRIPQLTTAFVVGLSESGPTFLDRLGRVTAEFLGGLGDALTEVTRAMGTVVVALPRAFGGGLLALSGGFGSALSELPRALGDVGSGVSLRRDRDRSSRRNRAATAAATEEAEEEPAPEIPPTIEEAWASMVDGLRLRNRRSATPGEYARAAVASGLPVESVRRLTRIFEGVRYGSVRRSAALTAAARAALSRIDEHRERDEEGDESAA
ncbi:DUF4129 domain-containing protein [Haloprofundus halobius]|uniref:DUF4129 domain-containing protein n=1 Tax=Haloprofundus halobius TaxID=2876194 RepID=UPI001CCA5A16|nr:DUF4129 domain-containing protein [Haloprofundus halobius]